MYFNLDWQINIGSFGLAILESCEVHSSVDTLADVCTITLPGGAYGKAFRVEQQIKRGDPVTVKAGYNGALQNEFTGYLLNIGTDDNNLTLNCEDALFLMRKAVKDKSFKGSTVKSIVEYLLAETGVPVQLSCTLTMGYKKFVIHKATAYDVLKKLQDETAANIYMRWLESSGKWELNIHPPYVEKFGQVGYSFQQNIESSSLKYVRSEDKKIEIVVETVSQDGKKKEERFGTSGGNQITIKAPGMDDASLKKRAETEYLLRMTDGYEGDITGWLIPFVQPGYTAELKDADYEYKDGWYYVNAVTTTISQSGGVRKVQLGFKTAANG